MPFAAIRKTLAMVRVIIAEERRQMPREQIGSPEISGHLQALIREIHRLETYDAVMIASAIMRCLAEYLHDLGVEVELSTKSDAD